MRRMMLGMLVTLLCAAPSFAATISVRPVLVAVLDEQYSPVDPSIILAHDPLVGATLAPRDGHYVLQVCVVLNVTDLLPGQLGFGRAEFNLNLIGLTQNRMLPGWIANTGTVDSNGSLRGGIVPKWADNHDAGESGTDLQEILFGTVPRNFTNTTGGNADPRRTLGIPPFDEDFDVLLVGEFVGNVYLDYPADASLPAAIELIPINGAVYNAQGDYEYLGVLVTGGRVTLPIPEPPGVVLLATCAAIVSVVIGRKRVAR